MITFLECSRPGYPARTEENVLSSDGTIAIAMDFGSPGERLTRSLCEKHGKPYLSLFYDTLHLHGALDKAWCFLRDYKIEYLNGAGNCLHHLGGDDQFTASARVYKFLLSVREAFPLELDAPTLLGVRSGGQTGIDEAFLHAGSALGLETICLAPKNWLYRNAAGRDVASEQGFKSRFL